VNSSLKRKPKGKLAAAWFLRILVLGATASVLLFSPLSSLSSQSGSDPSSITSYDAAMKLGANGTLITEERINVLTGFDRRGIFRIFDTAPRGSGGQEHPVSEVSVTRNGVPEPAEFISSAKGTETLRIGDANVILNEGSQQYVIRSATKNALEPAEDNKVLWWWDVVGSGWQMTMDRVQITATLPAEPEEVECVQGRSTPCTAVMDGRVMTVSTGPLAAFTPVTVRVTFPEGSLPTPAGEAPSNWPLAIGSLILGLAAVAISYFVFRATRESEPGMPVLFEPPASIVPALGVRVIDEDDTSTDLQATLFDLAARGVLQLAQSDDSWTVACIADPATIETHPGEDEVLAALGLHSPGDNFTVSRTSASGEQIAAARAALRTAVRAESAKYLKGSPAGGLARFLAWGGLIIVFVVAGIYHFGGSGTRFVPILVGAAVLALGLLGVALDPRTRTIHTDEGRDMWSRAGGFARFLSTDSSESRFDAAAHMDWFPRYLPWAVALGVTAEWAQRYEAQGVQLASNAVPWMFWYGGMGGWSDMSMTASFDSAISAASASYSAAQASSIASSVGGGFSGGSGGGGGGGGSW